MAILERIISPLRGIWTDEREPALEAKESRKGTFIPKGVELEDSFPPGYHVYGLTAGPSGRSGEIMIGASDPASSLGAVFLGSEGGPWERIDLPDETALVSQFLRLPDNTYLAGGMCSIGRGAILKGDASARNWATVDLDLHSYSSISALTELPDGSIIAASGQMITQGKTKPVLFRSVDLGKTWSKETPDLPISSFLSFEKDPDTGRIYAGTSGDVDPVAYYSDDSAKTWTALPKFPTYKTYKMPVLRLARTPQGRRLHLVLWGYKTAIADRVVRIYRLSADEKSWEELPPVQDSHFVFSFSVTSKGSFYIGAEKGKIYRSKDFAQSWEEITQFPTNIGAHAIYEDDMGQLWVGKDYVPPHDLSLWRLSGWGK